MGEEGVFEFITSTSMKSSEKPTKFIDRIGFSSILRNLPRTLLAFIFTGSWAVFMTAMQAVTDNRAIAGGLHQKAEDPLPDLLMDLAPDSLPMHLADLFLNSLIFFSVVMFLGSWWARCAGYGLPEGHFRTFRMARKFFWMLGFAYLFRSLSLLTTTMPPTDPRCVYKQRNWQQIPFTALEIMTKQGNTCSDKIFSGHSSMATFLCLFWLGALLRPERSALLQNSNNTETEKVALWRKIAAILILAWTVAVYIFCILCRNHYTVDVVVAILVCTGIFSIYQLSLRIIELVQVESLAKTPTANLDFISSFQQSSGGYSPLCTSPQITMIQILPEPENENQSKTTLTLTSTITSSSTTKNASSTSAHNKAPHISHVPQLFIHFLKSVAWMDGVDLKPS